MAAQRRTLRVSFESIDALRHEFDSNLSNGGLFVATRNAFKLRESVRVCVDLAFAGETLELAGDVVHVVPAEMAGAGGTPGVALQLTGNPADLRGRLSSFLSASPTVAPAEPGPRRTSRKRARVTAHLEWSDGRVVGRTRDLSRGGALVGIQGVVPMGEPVCLTLVHPASGERMTVGGKVVRQVEGEAGISAVGIEFSPAEHERDAVELFIEDIQRAEHARRLGGIVGVIEALGPQNIVQMFATTASEGTLYLRSGGDEGQLCFQGGLLRYARLGELSGMKALVRMLSWSDGSFEFHARLDDVPMSEAPLPLEAALLDAMRQIDEGSRVDSARFPLHALLGRGPESPDGHDLSKVEAAVLDLAQVGFSVERVLDVIPEPDSEIFRALENLTDEGIVRVEG